MSQYQTGTITASNGSAIITGVSTAFLTNISPGDIFARVGDNVWYEVGSVDSNLQITLTSNYLGVSGSGLYYAITRDFTPNLNLPYPMTGDIETAAIIKRALLDIDLGKHVVATPASASATGVAGTWAADVNFIYFCVAINTWKRTPISTWP